MLMLLYCILIIYINCIPICLLSWIDTVMATLIPPPRRKKAKTSHEDSSNTENSIEAPSVVVQFTSADDGSNLGPAVNLPADTPREALEVLVNQLKGSVSVV